MYHFPPPVPIKSEIEGEPEIDLRIPVPIEQPDEPLDIHAVSKNCCSKNIFSKFTKLLHRIKPNSEYGNV